MSQKHQRRKRQPKRPDTTLDKYSVTLFVKSNRVVQDVYARDGAEAVRRAKADFLAEVTADIRLANGLAQKIAKPVVQPSSLARVTPLGDPAYNDAQPTQYTVSARRAGKNAFAEAAAEVRESFDHPVDHTSGLRAALGDDGLTDAERTEKAEAYAKRIRKGDVTEESNAGPDGLEQRLHEGIVIDGVFTLPEAIAHAHRPKPGVAYLPEDEVWLIYSAGTRAVHVSRSEGVYGDALGDLAWCGIKPGHRHNIDLDEYVNVNCPSCKAAVKENQTRSRRS